MMFSKHSSLVFIDSTVPNYESLVHHVQPDATVVVLNAAEDGIAQITQVLADRTSAADADTDDRTKSDFGAQKSRNWQNHTAIATIHVVSHGTPGELQLGSTRLNAVTLNQYAEQIRSWSSALSPDAEILLYGCEVAAGATGEQFVQQLHQLTQAEIAASTHLTGSQDLGGDWLLDYATGEITATLAFDDEAIATYEGVLARDLVQEDFQGADVANPLWLFGVGAPEAPGDPVPANPFLTARATVAPSAGGLPGGGTDTPGAGALRLTGLANDQSSFVLYNGTPLPATEGVSVIFDFYSYAGTGADGISFFLLDGAASPTTSGAFGGSLGYAQKTTPTRAGITGGILGIGFDEYGNFANATEGRVGGAAAGVTGLLPDGRVPDAVTIRGSAATRYPFISTSGALSSSIDRPDVAEGNRAAARRRAKIDITPVAGAVDDGILTVKVDFNNNGSFQDPGELVIDNLGLNANGVQLPSTFKFGFASSTGSQTNIHEVNNLLVRNLTPGLSAFDPDGSQLTRLTTREGDAPLSLSLSLDSRPTSNVTVTLSSADTSEGTIAPTTLTFTPQNWDSRQTFTLTPQDDTEIDGDIAYNIVATTASTDTRYNSATPTPLFSVTNRDNEVALPTVSLAIAPPTLIESSPTPATITATLSSAATTPVTLTLGYTGTATQGTDYTAPTTITIPVGALTGTATITPTNDTLIEGPETVSVDIATATGATPATPSQPATLTITDSTAPSGNRLPIFNVPAGFDVQTGQTVGLPGISAADPDPDGSIAFYTITQVPPAPEGTLFIGNPAQGGVPVVLGQQLTGTQIGQLFFQSTPQFNGDSFTITATDNRGDSSSTVIPLRFVQVLSGNDEEDFNCEPGRNQTGSNARNVINGSIGSDRLVGRDGNDVLRGLRCNDLIDGGRGNDRILGGTGRDNLRGGVGNDFILGERGADVISGGVGNDRVLAGVGNDFANGNVGRDSVDGGTGDDIVNGGAQTDIVIGGVGNDLVIGAAGDDRIFGSAGDDELIGALGRDKINVRGGSDRIIYRARSEFGDRIDRFEVNQDVIDLRPIFRGARFDVSNRFGRFVQLQQSGRSTLVRVDTNGTAAGGFVTAAEVFNVPRNTITASNFLV